MPPRYYLLLRSPPLAGPPAHLSINMCQFCTRLMRMAHYRRRAENCPAHRTPPSMGPQSPIRIYLAHVSISARSPSFCTHPRIYRPPSEFSMSHARPASILPRPLHCTSTHISARDRKPTEGDSFLSKLRTFATDTGVCQCDLPLP